MSLFNQSLVLSLVVLTFSSVMAADGEYFRLNAINIKSVESYTNSECERQSRGFASHTDRANGYVEIHTDDNSFKFNFSKTEYNYSCESVRKSLNRDIGQFVIRVHGLIQNDLKIKDGGNYCFHENLDIFADDSDTALTWSFVETITACP